MSELIVEQLASEPPGPPEIPSVGPWDEHNQKWISYVHPAELENPEPKGRYNLLVLGAGPAGLVAAIGAAGLGPKSGSR